MGNRKSTPIIGSYRQWSDRNYSSDKIRLEIPPDCYSLVVVNYRGKVELVWNMIKLEAECLCDRKRSESIFRARPHLARQFFDNKEQWEYEVQQLHFPKVFLIGYRSPSVLAQKFQATKLVLDSPTHQVVEFNSKNMSLKVK